MESKAKLKMNGYNYSALIEYNEETFIVSVKPLWSRKCFGLVGEALASFAEKFRFTASDIVCFESDSTLLGSPKYSIKLSTGKKFALVFSNDNELTQTLKVSSEERN